MTVIRGFTITIVSGIVFACVGAFIGWTLGVVAPDYYHAVFRIPSDASVSMAQTGLGLGLTQGFALGIFTGLVIVVTVAWYNSRTGARQTSSQSL